MHNRRLSEITGIDPSLDLTGKTLDELCLINPTNAQARIGLYRKLLKQGGGEAIVELPTGRILRATCMPTNSKAWVMTIEDVTTRVQSERRIAHLARHDVLTGLPNRRQFIDALDRAISEADVMGSRVSIINIDLDRFKDINDTYGHAAGDTVLCVVPDRMQRGLRHGEMVARFGGDEFVAMKSYSKPEHLQEFIARLRKALTENISVDMVEMTPGASLGVAIYPMDAADREKLLGNADMAMLSRQGKLRGDVCVYEASWTRPRERVVRLPWISGLVSRKGSFSCTIRSSGRRTRLMSSAMKHC